MASSCCWNCLSKFRPSPRPLLPSTPSPSPIILRAPFHSTASQHAMPTKKSNSRDTGPKFRESRSARAPPKPKPSKPHRYTPDELKAMKTELSISNPNAVEVPGLQALSTENMADASSRGKMFALPPSLLTQLRALGVFKPSHSWHLFKKPSTLVREETLELGNLIRGIGAQEGELKGKSVKRIVTGIRGTGKSTHLMQAMTMALLSDWIVVNVPDGRDYTCGSTAYAPVAGTNPVQYTQKNASASLLDRIVKANKDILSKLHISQNLGTLGKAVPPSSTLHDLASFGAARPDNAWMVFQALWKELTAIAPAADAEGIKPFQPRPPMVVAVDGLAHWMTNTAYRNPDYEPIHAHDMTLVRHFLTVLSSPSSLPNGGIALFATSTCNNPRAPALDVSIKQLSFRQAGVDPTSPEFPLPDPYAKLDSRVLSFFNDANNSGSGLRVQELKGITKDDTRALLEYYALSGLLRERISEEVVGEKWTLAGGGVIGELERFGKRIRDYA
ncbi:hypothetical protein VTO42DRAFT_4613 [Malbranchea cinnamomea]